MAHDERPMRHFIADPSTEGRHRRPPPRKPPPPRNPPPPPPKPPPPLGLKLPEPERPALPKSLVRCAPSARALRSLFSCVAVAPLKPLCDARCSVVPTVRSTFDQLPSPYFCQLPP